MLPAGKKDSQVFISKDGLAKNCKPRTIIIDMSAVSLEESKMFANKLKEYEVHCIDAPVSGGEPMALEGKLSIMAGGDKEHFNKILPLFESIGETIVHFGTNGTGTAAKLANQITNSHNLAALSEACVLASKSAIHLTKIFDAIRGGLAGSAVMDAKMPLIIDRNFEPGGRIETNFKDLANVK